MIVVRSIVVAGFAGLGPVIGCVGCGGNGGSPGGGALPGQVIGKSVTTCHQLHGNVDVPLVLTQRIVQAYVPDRSAAGYRVVTGTVRADGTFEIDGVPDGVTYLLDLEPMAMSPARGSELYVTDQHDIELRADTIGRCTPAPTKASAAAIVDIDLTNMSTLFNTQSDAMELRSFGLGFGIEMPFDLNPGDQFSGMEEWPQGAPLVDPSAGDDLYVLHVRSEFDSEPATNRGRIRTHILDAFDATGKSLQVGPATVITGRFPPPPPSQTGVLTIDHAQFAAGYGVLTRPGRVLVQLTAHPATEVADGLGPAAILAGVEINDFAGNQLPAGTSRVSYSYLDPFPASWKRALTVEYDQDRYMRLSATARTTFAIGGYVARGPAPAVIAAAPQLAPPSGITIAGADFLAGGKIAFDGVSPVVVRWSAVPSAQLYRLSLFRSLNDPSMRFDLVGGAVTTADTMLTLPAALFTSGGIYALALAAIQTPVDYRSGHLRPPLVPEITATTSSGRFRFTASCGNGVVDPGEDCDTAGESAACNVDCTAAMCGDGLRNAAAGEACDSVQDSVGCTAGCALRTP